MRARSWHAFRADLAAQEPGRTDRALARDPQGARQDGFRVSSDFPPQFAYNQPRHAVNRPLQHRAPRSGVFATLPAPPPKKSRLTTPRPSLTLTRKQLALFVFNPLRLDQHNWSLPAIDNRKLQALAWFPIQPGTDPGHHGLTCRSRCRDRSLCVCWTGINGPCSCRAAHCITGDLRPHQGAQLSADHQILG